MNIRSQQRPLIQEADVMKKACHRHLAELLSGLPAIFGSLNLAFAATCIK